MHKCKCKCIKNKGLKSAQNHRKHINRYFALKIKSILGPEVISKVKSSEVLPQSDACFPGLKDINESHAGLLGKLLTTHTLLQQGLFDGFSCAAPQFVLPAVLSDHHSAERVFGRRPVHQGQNTCIWFHAANWAYYLISDIIALFSSQDFYFK